MLDLVDDLEVAAGPAPEFRPLSKHDRCDRCGAEAFIIAVDTEGRELLFCGHHGKRYSLGLVSQGFKIDDQLYRINEKPSPSASELE